MGVRIREKDLVLPALKAAAGSPNGEITTSALIDELEAQFQPEGIDAELLDGRNDTHFSQKVRNLVSHRQGQHSMFTLGYAEYTGDGLRITESGKKLLSQLPE